MGTPLYTTDVIPMTSRPTLTVMGDGDYFVILDTSTGKISKILKTNIVLPASQVSYDNATSGLTATQVQAALDELVVNLGSSDSAISAIKGVDYTDGTLKTHEDRLDTLEGADTVAGSVAKTVKDTAQDATYDNAGTGIEATTVKTAISELDARLVDAEAHVYGLDYDETTGVCTRLLDAVGLTVGAPDGVNPIASDFDSCYPWSAIHHVKIALGGTRKEPFEDGYDIFDGEIMTVLPRFYYKDYRSGGHRYMYISDKKKAGFKLREESLIASFPVSKVGTEYRSRVGEVPKTNESYTTFIQGFYAQGDGKWSMYDCLHALVLLTCIEAGTMNHKGAYGRGINSGMPYDSTAVYKLTADTVAGNDVVLADSGQPFYVGMTVQIGTAYTNNSVAQDRVITNVVRAGGVLTLTLDGAPFSAVIGNSCVAWGQSVPQAQFDTMGDGSGYILQHESANRSHVCYRGVWNLWGNVWQFYAGFMRYNGRYYGCTDPTKYNISDPRGADGWVDLGIGEYAENGYQQIREGIVIDGVTIDVPVTWGSIASSETYYSAYLYNFNSTYTGTRVLRLGGFWSFGGYDSLVCSVGSYSPSNTGFDIGSRLFRS